MSGLKKEGVKFKDDGKLDFYNSTFEGLKKPQKLLQSAYDRVTRGEDLTALDAHRMKTWLETRGIG